MEERGPHFDELEVGAEYTLKEGPLTRTHFVRYAGAAGDFNPNHHDEIYAIRSGNERVFAMGMLQGGFLSRMLTDWLGDGRLRRYRIRFTARAWPGDMIICKGKVTRKFSEGGENLVECEAVAENQHGEKLITGTATAALPKR